MPHLDKKLLLACRYKFLKSDGLLAIKEPLLKIYLVKLISLFETVKYFELTYDLIDQSLVL